jgi:uncharacterized membrane protein
MRRLKLPILLRIGKAAGKSFLLKKECSSGHSVPSGVTLKRAGVFERIGRCREALALLRAIVFPRGSRIDILQSGASAVFDPVWSRKNSRFGHRNHSFAVDFFERLTVVDTNGKPAEPKSQLKNRIFIAIVVLTNAAGNVLLAVGMKQMPDFDNVSVMGYTASLFTNLWVLSGIALLIVWMVAQLSMFSWADLTYVLPVTAAGYIVTAILGKFFLGETVSIMRWAGIVVISFGVVLVSETPPHEPRGDRP